jgi:NAD(P)-dependent dehydrogenase (short-subunit alcohol dehydrogenase family)
MPRKAQNSANRNRNIQERRNGTMEIGDAVVVISGAARGIGKKIASEFAERDAHVVVVDILPEQLAETARELQTLGGRIRPVVTDITDPQQVDMLAAQVVGEFGHVDILVNNAGTLSDINPVWEADPQGWMRDIKVNLIGSFLMCRAFVKHMVTRKRGYVINMVSAGGVGDPHPYLTSYASSKTGLMRLTEGLDKEVEEYGIKVFAVAPPAILSDMTRFILTDAGGQKWRPNFKTIFEERADYPPEVVSRLILALLSGKYDSLHGRFIHAAHNLDETLAYADRIIAQDLMTLRINCV